jgi:hypothetical protein
MHPPQTPQVDDAMNVELFEEKPPESTLHTMSMDSACYEQFGEGRRRRGGALAWGAPGHWQT